MSTPVNPLQNAQQAPASPFIQQAQQTFSNPAASSVPQQQGIAGLANHPIVQAILKAISSGAGAYGWTSMPPQQRLESQQLEQQKAEAMARLGMQGQQLGLEQQRVGYEGQRTQAEVAASGAAAERSKAETAAIPQRTAIEQKTATIAQQRADQEHQDRIAEHELLSKQLEEEVRAHGAEEKLGAGRLGVEREANKLAGERIDMEKKHFEDTIAMQGRQYTRQLAEDERKTLHESLDKYYAEHPFIANLSGTGPQTIQQKHKDIDNYIDKKIGVSSGQGGQPSGVTHIYVPGKGIQPVGGQNP